MTEEKQDAARLPAGVTTDSLEVIGCHVRDQITGLEGTVTGYTQQITGCNRVTIQPRLSSLSGTQRIPDSYYVNESHIDIIHQSKLADNTLSANEKRGGPMSTGIQL